SPVRRFLTATATLPLCARMSGSVRAARLVEALVADGGSNSFPARTDCGIAATSTARNSIVRIAGKDTRADKVTARRPEPRICETRILLGLSARGPRIMDTHPHDCIVAGSAA